MLGALSDETALQAAISLDKSNQKLFTSAAWQKMQSSSSPAKRSLSTAKILWPALSPCFGGAKHTGISRSGKSRSTTKTLSQESTSVTKGTDEVPFQNLSSTHAAASRSGRRRTQAHSQANQSHAQFNKSSPTGSHRMIAINNDAEMNFENGFAMTIKFYV